MTNTDAAALVRHISLRQLQIFSTVARTGGYRLAAEALFVTQPSISGHIKKLCDAVGLPVFERVGNEMRLTPGGQQVLAAAEDILDRLARLQRDISEIKSEVRGRLSIGAVSTAKYFLPQLLGAFLQRYPAVEPQMAVTNRAKLLDRLNNHEYDLVVMGQVPDEMAELVEIEPFLDNRLVVVADPGHALTQRRSIPRSRITRERFLLREPGSGTRLAVDRAFVGIDPPLLPYMELGSSEAIKQAVISGLGLSVLSMHSLRMELAGSYLAVLDVEGFPLQRCWHAVHWQEQTLSLVARTFLSFLREQSSRVLQQSEHVIEQMQAGHPHDGDPEDP